MTKREELIDEILQLLSRLDEIPFSYKQLRIFMDRYLDEQKELKKKNKREKKEHSDIKVIYQNFVKENIKNGVELQKILELWEIRSKELSI